MAIPSRLQKARPSGRCLGTLFVDLTAALYPALPDAALGKLLADHERDTTLAGLGFAEAERREILASHVEGVPLPRLV